MTKFIHTGDWQIGKPYLQIKDSQKRFKLQNERICAIKRIKDITQLEDFDFILIAGDLFDSPTPSSSSVVEVLSTIGDIEIPVLAIPGNHDYGGLGTVWYRDDFIKYNKSLAPNFNILLKKQPFELEKAVILPCPLLRNKDTIDPTIWLRGLNLKEVSSEKPRIVLAHGGVYTFKGMDYSLESRSEKRENNYIDLDHLQNGEIDYFALGDWHNLKEVKENAWYSGTPEADRFNQGEYNNRGQILKVKVSRGSIPKVTPISTGRIQWHNISYRLNKDEDVENLEEYIKELTCQRVGSDLLRIEISGSLSLKGYQRFEQMKFDLENKLIRLRIKGQCQRLPNENEIEQLISNPENPLVSEVAAQLQKTIENEENNESDKTSLRRIALSELFRLAIKGD